MTINNWENIGAITGASGGIIGADNTPKMMAELVVLAHYINRMLLTNIYNNSRCGCLVVVEQYRWRWGGVFGVSCHPLPTSNVYLQSGGAGINNSFRNGSDTVFGSTTPIATGGGGCGGSNSGAHRGKDGDGGRR